MSPDITQFNFQQLQWGYIEVVSKIRLSESKIKLLPIPKSKQVDTYSDCDPPNAKNRISVPGLYLTVSSTCVKSFVLRKKFQGRTRVITIGQHPGVNVDTARKIAKLHMQDMAQGIDPVLRKKAEDTRNITLSSCFEDYLKNRELSKNTISNYKTVFDLHLHDWKRKPLITITRDLVRKRHKKLSLVSATSANKTMRVLRAIFNFANGQYENERGDGLFPHNPVTVISHNKQWNRETRRATRIADTDLKAWFDAVSMLESELSAVHQDYFVFLLLTGLRRREATSLKWSDINFKNKSFTIEVTKNHRPITLPLSDYALVLLEIARERKVNTEYVFHGLDIKASLKEPKRQVKRVQDMSGVAFMIHDLRRTFISIAESLDISMYAIKAIVNHGTTSGDVTAGYVVWDIERLRKPMQNITDYILKCAEIKPSAQIVEFESQRI